MPEDMQHDQQRGQDYGSRPVPDPTVLTTEALQREILALRQLVELRVVALRDLTWERIDGLEKQLTCEQELRDETITSLKARMQRTEEQRVEQKADTKTAIDDALTAQKEAVGKSEAATNKQLQEIKTTIDTTVDGLRRELGDLKERITTIEQQRVGAREQSQGLTASTGMAIAASGVFVALVAVIANILTSQ